MSKLVPVRIAMARLEAGYSTAEAFGNAVGVSGQAVRDWEKGKSHPRPANLERIMELTNKPRGYFYAEEARNGVAADELRAIIERAGGLPAGEMVALPVYDRASAGAGGIGDGQPTEYRHVPRTWIPEGQEADCYFVRVTGESMTGAGISEGDLLLVCTAVPVHQGDVAIVRIGEEVVVKRVQALDDALILISEHNEYPARRVDGEEVRIIGRVMWSRKDF